MNVTPLEKWISEKTGIPGRPDAARLRQYQLERLRGTLRLVTERSRFYKERLHGIAPESVASVEDLARLPFTYPGDIAARPTDFLCVSPRDIGRIVTLSTSGTTGPPKRLYFTEEDQELTVDFFHRGMTTLTDATDRVMIFMPGATEGSVGDLLKKGLKRFGCDSVAYGPIRDYGDAYNALRSEKITAIVGIPSQVLTLSRIYTDNPGVKNILLSADYVPEGAAGWLRETWGATVYSHYGMTETGLGGGVECAAGDGYHLREADLLFEIVEPATGRAVPDGEYGEVVFTTLTRRGMPLVRYRTGDRARFLTAPCPCGSVLRRLGRVTGRLGEAVTLPEGRTLSITELDELVLSDKSVSAFEAALTDAGGSDRLTITVSCDGSAFDREALAQRLDGLLGGLVREGRLTLEIKNGPVGFFTTGTLKRRITDTRNKH
jgi:phenylacetate-CoA ligase